MSSSYVCPCCFLNRISILRESEGSRMQLQNRFKHRNCSAAASSETVATESRASLSTQVMFRDVAFNNLNHVEDMLQKLKSGASMSDYDMNCSDDQHFVSESSMDCSKKSTRLAEQIDCVLKEQKKFLRELNLDIPVNEEDWYTVMGDQNVQPKSGDTDVSSINVSKKRRDVYKQDFTKLLKTGKVTDTFFAGGDKLWAASVNTLAEARKEDFYIEDNKVSKINRPTIYFNEEPVKLPKPFQCTLTSNDSNFNRDYAMDKNVSVKLLFFPEVALKGSSTSMITDDGMSTASVYVTAANSIAEQVPGVYNIADSSSNFQLKSTQSSTMMH